MKHRLTFTDKNDVVPFEFYKEERLLVDKILYEQLKARPADFGHP